MKQIFFTGIFFLLISVKLAAQNVGIGTAEPYNKLQVNGNFAVTTPAISTNTAPTVAQTKTMVNAATISFAVADSTGRIYDPGGPAGNYIANITAYASIAASGIGIEVTAESMNLGAGDSLIIKESGTGRTLLAVGNNYSSLGKWIFNSPGLYVTFKSDANASVGTGFALLFRRLYDNSSQLNAAGGYAGSSLVFDIKNSSLQSGLYTNAPGNYAAAFGNTTIASGNGAAAFGRLTTASGNNAFATGNAANAAGYASIASGDGAAATGYGSSAFGVNTTASGNYSFATGFSDTASGVSAIAMGSQCKALANYAVAIGDQNRALANYATAMGYFTDASGHSSTTMGFSTYASGQSSTAMGYNTSATGFGSTAMGASSWADGDYSTAMGDNTQASGLSSTAMGFNSTASGSYSTAIGIYASTNNQPNSLAIGGTGALTVCNSPNQFMARFDNYTFFVTPSSYAYLIPSSNGWAYTSDKNKKEQFEELDGETVLKKMASIPLYSWNFKDSRPYRHYGIMAQDFFNAFGKDSYGTIGNDTTVSSLDLIGVAYSAIKALEKRTAQQQAENEQLKNENIALQKRLVLFEAKLNELMAVKLKDAAVKTSVTDSR